MKFTDLESTLAAHVKLGQEVENLQALQSANAQALADLEANADLQDPKALNEITRKQTLDRLLPTRLQALAAKQEDSKRSLCAGAMQFISQTLRPKINEVRDDAVQKIKKAISSVFSNEDQIEIAVNQSDLIISIDSLHCIAQGNPDNEIRYVNELIANWKEIHRIEKTI